MKYTGRYWLFGGYGNIPCGGMSDYVESYATHDAATNAGYRYSWCQIFDSKEKKVRVSMVINTRGKP